MAEPDVCAPIDANGNLTSDGTRTFEWDAVNRLSSVTSGAVSLEYTRDAIGRVASMTVVDGGSPQSSANFVWCDLQVCEQRIQGGTAVHRSFNLGMVQDGVAVFFTRDHQVSVRSTSDNSALVTGRQEFDPFGRQSASSISDVKSDGFGLLNVADRMGLSAATFRSYDSSLGRWISEDPVGMIDGPNRYAYALGNPLKYIDSLGLWCQIVARFPVTPWLLQSRTESNPSTKFIGTEVNGMEEGPGMPGRGRIGIPFGIVSCVYRKTFSVGRTSTSGKWTRGA